MSQPSSLFELVVLSGKGGTGKTSVSASLAVLAREPAMADCDVDASNLPLVLAPRTHARGPFTNGVRARILPDRCTACGKCEELCRYDAVFRDSPEKNGHQPTFRIDTALCEGCGVCFHFCPARAIELAPNHGGEWFLSHTQYGPLSHARLVPGQGNSGKLAALVRENGRRAAREEGRQFLLIDGPPGVGCPAIASLTGASLLLAVTEPTPSGEHDIDRLIRLARHFSIPTWVCVNKYDLNLAITERITQSAMELGARVAGTIPYDPEVTAAQRQRHTVVEHGNSPAAQAIVRLWNTLAPLLPNQSLVSQEP